MDTRSVSRHETATRLHFRLSHSLPGFKDGCERRKEKPSVTDLPHES